MIAGVEGRLCNVETKINELNNAAVQPICATLNNIKTVITDEFFQELKQTQENRQTLEKEHAIMTRDFIDVQDSMKSKCNDLNDALKDVKFARNQYYEANLATFIILGVVCIIIGWLLKP